MPAELDQLYQDLDLDQLRVQRPSKFIFFCGGATSDDARDASSMRHYLLNEKNIGRRLNASVVLAEKATQLYRDTKYDDLITFEEDIAKISAMVLVIAESAGSLAELGAFSSNDTIRRYLTILMQQEYAEKESFVRYGPVERIKKEDNERVAFFPWRVKRNGHIVKISAYPHIREIVGFINDGLDKIPTQTLIQKNIDLSDFILLYWIVYLSTAIPLGKLSSYATNIICDHDERIIRKKLYCMQLAGWIGTEHYSNKDYYFCRHDVDPIQYRFRPGVGERESIRRKADVVKVIQDDLALPKHVRKVAIKSRKRQ